MTMFMSVLSIFCIASLATAIQTDWIGTYSDPTYGGNLAVCVSLVNGVYYGQGLISDVGYLRGTIDSSNVWSGNYYLAGIEAERGTFVLTLSGDLSSYSGTYTQAGSSVTYSVTTASRSSSTTPSDVECFKSDDSMLVTTTFFNVTGAYDVCDAGDCYTLYNTLIAGTTLTTSYSYTYEDGTVAPGTSTGPVFANGQVILDNWYETGSDTGIELQVAKNSTHMYSLWWFVPSMSDFDYTIKSTDYFSTDLIFVDPSVSVGQASRMATSNMCYALWTETAESSCTGNSATTTSNDDDDSFDDEDRSLLITILAFVLLIFVIILVMLIMTLMNFTSKAPLASQQSSVQMK